MPAGGTFKILHFEHRYLPALNVYSSAPVVAVERSFAMCSVRRLKEPSRYSTCLPYLPPWTVPFWPLPHRSGRSHGLVGVARCMCRHFLLRERCVQSAYGYLRFVMCYCMWSGWGLESPKCNRCSTCLLENVQISYYGTLVCVQQEDHGLVLTRSVIAYASGQERRFQRHQIAVLSASRQLSLLVNLSSDPHTTYLFQFLAAGSDDTLL